MPLLSQSFGSQQLEFKVWVGTTILEKSDLLLAFPGQ